MRAQLHEIWPAGAYCGPSALAALTGCDAKKDIRAWVNAVRGRPASRGVLGMNNREMSAVLASRGYGFTMHKREDRPTLLQLAAEAQPDVFYLVNVTRHYVALLNGRVADNHVRAGCAVTDHPAARKRVKATFEILPTPEGRP